MPCDVSLPGLGAGTMFAVFHVCGMMFLLMMLLKISVM